MIDKIGSIFRTTAPQDPTPPDQVGSLKTPDGKSHKVEKWTAAMAGVGVVSLVASGILAGGLLVVPYIVVPAIIAVGALALGGGLLLTAGVATYAAYRILKSHSTQKMPSKEIADALSTKATHAVSGINVTEQFFVDANRAPAIHVNGKLYTPSKRNAEFIVDKLRELDLNDKGVETLTKFMHQGYLNKPQMLEMERSNGTPIMQASGMLFSVSENKTNVSVTIFCPMYRFTDSASDEALARSWISTEMIFSKKELESGDVQTVIEKVAVTPRTYTKGLEPKSDPSDPYKEISLGEDEELVRHFFESR